MCIICILFSIAAVSANDNQTDELNLNPISDDRISINDNDKLMEVTNKSYNDFYENIKDCNVHSTSKIITCIVKVMIRYN